MSADVTARALASHSSMSAGMRFLGAVERFAKIFEGVETLDGWQRAICSLGRECRDQYLSLALMGEALKFWYGEAGIVLEKELRKF